MHEIRLNQQLVIVRLLPASAKSILVWGIVIVCSAFAAAGITSASAAECNGKSDSLGVDRIIAVDPSEHPRIGTMQYEETLPLTDHEVVLTFDDGPSPRYTDRVLDALAAECVKATFFMVGEMAKLFSAEAKKVEAGGHTIGTHSFHHPFTFNRMTQGKAGAEIDAGIDAVGAALGRSSELAPFFRVPGFLTSKPTEAAIASRGLMTWSADVPSDDWRGIGSAEIVRRTMSRLETKGRGILLFHDIHEHTVEALPEILKELKLRGYRVAQIVPACSTVAKTETTPEQWRLSPAQATAAGDSAPSDEASSLERGSAKKTLAIARGGQTHMAGARRARKRAQYVAGGRAANRHVRDLGCRARSRKDQQPCAPSHRGMT